MTTRQPGADPDADGMWSPALARGLIRHDALRSIRICDGYTDLLGQNGANRPTLMQRAKESPKVAAALSLHGLTMSAWRERAAAALHLVGERRVLDVACGRGELTSFIADKLDGDGLVIGLDNSLRMIERAVDDNTVPRAVYMRAEALSPPFDDGAFDAVCCFALHLVAEPIGVLGEMVRVLAPGGRIAVLTSYGRESVSVRKAVALGATICGVRVFDRTTIPAFFAAAGLTDIDQQLRGFSQFVTARRPDEGTALNRWLTRTTGRSAHQGAIQVHPSALTQRL
jgi:SAM-dependent methyltransferase